MEIAQRVRYYQIYLEHYRASGNLVFGWTHISESKCTLSGTWCPTTWKTGSWAVVTWLFYICYWLQLSANLCQQWACCMLAKGIFWRRRSLRATLQTGFAIIYNKHFKQSFLKVKLQNLYFSYVLLFSLYICKHECLKLKIWFNYLRRWERLRKRATERQRKPPFVGSLPKFP